VRRDRKRQQPANKGYVCLSPFPADFPIGYALLAPQHLEDDGALVIDDFAAEGEGILLWGTLCAGEAYAFARVDRANRRLRGLAYVVPAGVRGRVPRGVRWRAVTAEPSA
jgi:hypothetical protein